MPVYPCLRMDWRKALSAFSTFVAIASNAPHSMPGFLRLKRGPLGAAQSRGGIHVQNYQRRSGKKERCPACRVVPAGEPPYTATAARRATSAIASVDDPRRNRETRSVSIESMTGRYWRSLSSSLVSLIRMTTPRFIPTFPCSSPSFSRASEHFCPRTLR